MLLVNTCHMNTAHDMNNDVRMDGTRRPGSGLCPFVSMPMDECYCKSLSSLQVADAVFYCTGNYPICPVYKALGNS